MAKIIPLAPPYTKDREYTLRLEICRDMLHEMENQLFDYIINIASYGVWKDWYDAIPEGQVMTFTEDMFEDIEDPNVLRLIGLQSTIEEVRLAIEKGCVYPSKQVLLEE